MLWAILVGIMLSLWWRERRRMKEYVEATERYCLAIQQALNSLNNEVDDMRTKVHKLEQAQAAKIWPIDVSQN